MERPSWYPVREAIHTATGDWCEAKCQEAEQAMVKAIIGELERLARDSWEQDDQIEFGHFATWLKEALDEG